MEMIHALEYLGLNEKEGKIYTTLLSLGIASVYSIALKGGLKRPTAYVIVDELIKKGVVSRIPRTRKKLYQAKPPEELMAEAENKFWLVKQKLPELQALVKGQDTKPRVFFFEGINGLQQTLMYGLKRMENKEITGFYATASAKTLKQFSFFKDFNDTLRQLHIAVRGAVPDDPKIQFFRDTDKAYNRHFKKLALDKYSSTVSVEMGDNYVKIQDWENLQSLIIENELICKTLKQIFELVWSKY